MDFVYLLRVLLKRKWIIIGSAIIAAGIAWFFTRNEEKQYLSISQVSTGFTSNDIVKLNDNNDFYETDTKFNNVIVTFTSPTVISLLSYKVMLHDLQNPAQPFRTLTAEQKQTPVYMQINVEHAKILLQHKLDSMSILTSYKPDEKKMLEFLKLYKYDYNSISKNLNVYRVERTDYIQINYASENPELSAFMVNTVFQEFVRYYRFIRTERSAVAIDTLQSLLERYRSERDQKNEAVKSTGGINPENGTGGASYDEQLAGLQTQLANEKAKQTNASLQLQKIKNKLAGLGTVTTQATSNDELVAIKKQRDDAYAAYLQSGSADQNLLNQYNRLKTQYLNKLSQLNANKNQNSTNDENSLLDKKSDLEVDIDASTTQINYLQGQINALQGNIQTQANKNATAQILSKDADIADKEYAAIQEKYNDALDMNNAAVNNFHQILVGQPAIEPEPSKRYLIVGMAGGAVFVLVILVIIFLTYLDSSIKTPFIFSRIVNLKLLSMVNFMNLKNKMLADVVANTNVPEDSEEKNRNNVFRESIRKLRYEIEHSGKKVFLFTSTKKGQGKTTLIQALSYSLSLSKKKVLIVDTNFCNNDLTVQLSGTAVLEQIVVPEINDQIIQNVKDAAVEVRGGAVYIIGCGGGDYTPAEILPSKHLLMHLQKLTEVYDYVFLEGPPLNDFSDSKELTEYVDGVVAIFSARHIIKQIDKESISFFKSLNGKFCGSVLNMVELENLNDV
ncbi:MAG TPA: AAA family ATPase [Parafilimonas sp.]|nr:AAA family ATPase [Parafilimonas sp.]